MQCHNYTINTYTQSLYIGLLHINLVYVIFTLFIIPCILHTETNLYIYIYIPRVFPVCFLIRNIFVIKTRIIYGSPLETFSIFYRKTGQENSIVLKSFRTIYFSEMKKYSLLFDTETNLRLHKARQKTKGKISCQSLKKTCCLMFHTCAWEKTLRMVCVVSFTQPVRKDAPTPCVYKLSLSASGLLTEVFTL